MTPLTHEQCPRCKQEGRDRGENNLVVYPDGHGYCFAGHGIVRAASIKAMLTGRTLASNEVELPFDSSPIIPAKALEWLHKYGITTQEVRNYHIKWSEATQWLIFPIYGETYGESLLGFQARNFKEHGTKYFTRGSFESIINYYSAETANGDRPSSKLILVEDMISAIKIARQFTAMPLFGSFLTVERGRKLKNFFSTLTFWLDYDKAISSIQQAQRFKSHGFKTSVIITQNDPKDYSDEEIKEIVNEF